MTNVKLLGRVLISGEILTKTGLHIGGSPGALAIGKLKIKIETDMIKRATEAPSGLFDYAIAYDIGKQVILKKLAKAKEAAAAPKEQPKSWMP